MTETATAIVRHALPEDLPALVRLGRTFLVLTEYGQSNEIPADRFEIGLCRILEQRDSCCFVLDIDGGVHGAILGTVVSYWFDDSTRVARELGWWVDEQYRGYGVHLLREFEGWAHEMRCRESVLSDLVLNGATPAGPLFEKLGYRPVERSHLKSLGIY